MFWYFDQNNKQILDTIQLVNGKFHVEGTVNRACEALVWTDLSQKVFDGPTMFRFMLQPGHTAVRFDGSRALVEGSGAQAEKDSWDGARRDMLAEKERCYDTLLALARRLKEKKDTELVVRLGKEQERWVVLMRKIEDSAIKYIERNPDSYFSGQLLYHNRRRMSVDSLQRYYTSLSEEVKESTIGHEILLDLYPLSNDTVFRRANPMVAPEVAERLRNTNSIYDLVLRDSAGKLVNLDVCRGKYVVIDLWASWCKPCIENVPALTRLIREYQGKPVQFVSISLDREERDWKKAMLAHPTGGLQLIDTAAFNSVAAIYCKAIYVPTYVIVDPHGRIVRYQAPQAVEAELKQLLDELIGE